MLTPASSLEVLSFFAADVQAGIGPFLGVFLQAHHWSPDRIGFVMTIGGIAGMLVASPAGALVDATSHRRAVVAAAGVLTAFAALAVWLSHGFVTVSVTQIATAIASATLGPAMTGITLGMVRRSNFDRQYARNQVANHAGNLTAAALSGWLGWRYGIGAVLALSAAFGVLSIAAVLTIPARAVDHHHARGLVRAKEDDNPQAGKLRILIQCRPLLLLAAALALFNVGNSAMLPLYSLAMIASGHGNPSVIPAETIVISQIVMLIAAAFAHRLIQRFGYWWILLATLVMLPLRGMLAAAVIQSWGIWPIETCDGIAAGLQSVVVPAIVVHLLHGSGRVNLGQGVVLTVEALGASMSPALGGLLANRFGYSIAFFVLGCTSIASLAIWLGFGRQLRAACAARGDERPEPSTERTGRPASAS